MRQKEVMMKWRDWGRWAASGWGGGYCAKWTTVKNYNKKKNVMRAKTQSMPGRSRGHQLQLFHIFGIFVPEKIMKIEKKREKKIIYSFLFFISRDLAECNSCKTSQVLDCRGVHLPSFQFAALRSSEFDFRFSPLKLWYIWQICHRLNTGTTWRKNQKKKPNLLFFFVLFTPRRNILVTSLRARGTFSLKMLVSYGLACVRARVCLSVKGWKPF